MSTNACPACGYPTLEPVLCAFCGPDAMFAGDQVFGSISPVAALRGSSLAGVADVRSVAALHPTLGPAA
ncbi:hypothetical protein Mkiyose1665_34470 [Mycobacterium kiyosense]|uniref:Uncharacterized protein n=1 Tax=Mycobacterium kiyosense TaxID=2871094 RepID=A0A9P3Q9E8_9MYCO|nr:hypothetical protein IWGMT90018_55290 [Mycobacterium kiyosense]BDE16560.1 hypothetical protein MKCMC460_54200 [Mycobacterium sp. 20KCMC460]GLB84546.1 hypothetical protein SRL2020028_38020 [Mycobacterium kiyosense]GLB92008.1 hypothetical protein SRL2020130_48250 [Mycobacterium kiyosense]GLB96522.1 hypothetical protein SRL2020226_32980 [Mycobacterium kiyosense]